MKKILAILIAIALAGCEKKKTEEKYAAISKAGWLEGRWENGSDEGTLVEIWQKENDSVYKAVSNFIKKKDTLHYETMTLSQEKDVVFLTSTIIGENAGKPVAYKMSSETPTKIVFENPKHDFPRRIVYNKVTADSMVIQVIGTRQGKPLAETYPMSKIENQ